MDPDPELIARAARDIQSGTDLEATLAGLRANGVSKVGSMKALIDSGRFDITTAKAAVHHSRAWQDVRARDDAFHDAIERAVMEQDSDIE